VTLWEDCCRCYRCLDRYNGWADDPETVAVLLAQLIRSKVKCRSENRQSGQQPAGEQESTIVVEVQIVCSNTCESAMMFGTDEVSRLGSEGYLREQMMTQLRQAGTH
jgi:hypothetical protein